MRSTESAINRYAVGIVPTISEAIPTFLSTELKSIESAINSVTEGQYELTTVAPTKPREGMMRFAEAGVLGVNKGFYGYHSSAWSFLG